MSKKWVMIDGGVKDTATGMTFDSFWELLTVLNGQSKVIRDLAYENEKLKEQLDNFEFNWHQRCLEFDKDSLYVKDTHVELCLKDSRLYIKVFIPKINDSYSFCYRVTGKTLMNEIADSKELEKYE